MRSHLARFTLATMFWCGAAAAEVTLETAVSKVDSQLSESGMVERRLVPADAVLPGDELRYSIRFVNDSQAVVDAGRIIITNPIPDGTVYLPGTAGGDSTLVEYSTDGEHFFAAEPAEIPSAEAAAATTAPAEPMPPEADTAAAQPSAAAATRSLRWTYRQDLPPGAEGEVFFHVRMR